MPETMIMSLSLTPDLQAEIERIEGMCAEVRRENDQLRARLALYEPPAPADDTLACLPTHLRKLLEKEGYRLRSDVAQVRDYSLLRLPGVGLARLRAIRVIIPFQEGNGVAILRAGISDAIEDLDEGCHWDDCRRTPCDCNLESVLDGLRSLLEGRAYASPLDNQ